MANIIGEKVFPQVDDGGNRYVLLDDIIDSFITLDNGIKSVAKQPKYGNFAYNGKIIPQIVLSEKM
jgi:hypothetical protein